MKKLAYSKKIINEINIFNDTLDNTLDDRISKLYSNHMNTIKTYCEKLNKEYVQNLNKLIENIASGENLDVKMLKKKYIKGDVINTHILSDILSSKISSSEISSSKLVDNDDNILDKIVINDEDYYYEKKEGGNVYNKSTIIVGKYTNNVITFTIYEHKN